jgi:hypothetical protein
MTPDDVLEELLAIARRLDTMGPADPERLELEARRSELRSAAQKAALSARDPEYLKSELRHLRRRLAALDAETVKTPSWQTHLPVRLNDPDAPARLINRQIDELNAPERGELESRISELESRLEEGP